MLADHNSLIVPARDTNRPAIEKKNALLAACDAEIAAVDQLGLVDSWAEVHSSHPALKQKGPKGYTFGYTGNDDLPDPDRSLRWLDRIRVSQSLKGHLSKVFTTFLCKSDHKAVITACEPPVFHSVHPRIRCNPAFLADNPFVQTVSSQ